MKKSVIKAIAVLLAVVVIIVGTYMIIPREEIDRFNPFITKEDLYVQINEEPSPDVLRYEYSLVGYNEEGEKKEITFGTGRVLREQAFIMIKVKGSFVETWEEVQREDLPKNVASQF